MDGTKHDEKPIEQWTSEDFFLEASRVLGDEDENGDAVVCGAMMLAALRLGTNTRRLARFLHVSVDRLRPFVARLRSNGVFRHDGRISCDWFNEESGGLGFCMDVSVGLGLLARAKAVANAH